ncbi:MAG: epoxyqueuosine reductase [Candidatus Eisenbacteria sp.]|nr:epoxyqueuosine reductase [Candidatus Eisenbacteria bacterium]
MGIETTIAEHMERRHVLAWGVADLTAARDYLAGVSEGYVVDLPRAISIAVPFPREIVDLLAEGPSRTYLYFYRQVNNRLNHIALEIDSILSGEGYRSFPVPASRREGRERIGSIFPHRLAANLAGIGWIGKSGLLIHPDVGPRLRLVTILTDAPLETSSPVEDRCGSCTVCIEACPGGAIGERVDCEDWQGNRLDAAMCDRYLTEVRDRHGVRVCGLCLAACPWGKR